MSLWLLALLGLVWAAGVWFFHRNRIWLAFYILGAAGFAYFAFTLAHQYLNVDLYLAQSVAFCVHQLLLLFDIPSRIFSNAPGMLLVMVLTQRVGWTALEIGVESSAVLEITVLISLLLFYPGWSWKQRTLVVLLGIFLTWLANLLRMLLIAVMVHYLGKEVLVLAHTLIGKSIFFLFSIAIYWLLFTQISLGNIKKRLAAQPWGTAQ
jgi:exosortase family protein XrtG